MMKITKAFLNAKYDELYAKAQKVLDEHKPCTTSEGALCHYGTFCCNSCKHVRSSGCCVKALGCKLWICKDAGKCSPTASKQLRKLSEEATKFDLLYLRATKKEALLMSYSMNGMLIKD